MLGVANDPVEIESCRVRLPFKVVVCELHRLVGNELNLFLKLGMTKTLSDLIVGLFLTREGYGKHRLVEIKHSVILD